MPVKFDLAQRTRFSLTKQAEIMKKILLGFFVFIILVAVWDFAWWALGVKPLFPWLMNVENYSLIDVRTTPEYKLFHIDGAENRPELLLHPELLKPQNPRKPLVVICMTGHRSSVVAYRLKKQGFSKVHNLTFGMLGWLLSGGETKR